MVYRVLGHIQSLLYNKKIMKKADRIKSGLYLVEETTQHPLKIQQEIVYIKDERIWYWVYYNIKKNYSVINKSNNLSFKYYNTYASIIPRYYIIKKL